MLHEKFTLEPVVAYPFFVVGKRYWQDHSGLQRNNALALTLICLHSTSFHKETWEATIEDLFALQLQDGKNTAFIQDVWAIDCPNHGEAALLNKGVVEKHQGNSQTCWLVVFFVANVGPTMYSLLSSIRCLRPSLSQHQEHRARRRFFTTESSWDRAFAWSKFSVRR